MAGRKRGTVRVRGESISVVLDLGEQPWRRCPKCGESIFTDDARPELRCPKCGEVLDAPAMRRHRVWRSGFKNRTTANKALAQMLHDLDEGKSVELSDETVRQFGETWLRGLETSDLRPGTVEMYRHSLTAHVLPALGSAKLRDVTPARVVSWIDSLKAASIGTRTIEIAGITAGKLFREALDRELILRNPCDNGAVRKARPHAKAAEPTVWTAEETRTFLDSQRDDRLFPLWRLAIATGMRRGELAGLRWSDVSLDEGSLRVAHALVVVNFKVIESEPKTAKSRRVIALDPATVAALRQHKARQAEEKMAHRDIWTETGLVFTDERGQALHPQRITKSFERLAKAAGLPVLHLHGLRHGHATRGLENGVSLKVMSERLGHSSIRVTGDVYSHVSSALDHEAAAGIAAAIDGS